MHCPCPSCLVLFRVEKCSIVNLEHWPFACSSLKLPSTAMFPGLEDITPKGVSCRVVVLPGKTKNSEGSGHSTFSPPMTHVLVIILVSFRLRDLSLDEVIRRR